MIPIHLTEVTKVFRTTPWKPKVAVDNLSLEIPHGKIIGLLGPNGSGKSTTLKMILGFLHPTSGEIWIGDHAPSDHKARRNIGYLPENPRFQRFLTARQALSYYGGLLGLTGSTLSNRIDEMLDMVSLSQAQNERIQGFSKGMVQRLAIAQSLLHKPRLLIFDEPMSGLDPLGRMEIRKLIMRVHLENPEATLLFSSHILEDVEQLCSLVALLQKGKLMAFCPIQDLLVPHEEQYSILLSTLPDKLPDRWKKDAAPTPLGTRLTVAGSYSLIECLQDLKQLKAAILGIHSERRSLEEALFAGKPLKEVSR